MFNCNKEQFYFLVSAFCSRILNFNARKTKIDSILVIKLDEIGDMVYSLHVFSYLEKIYPNVPISLLCKPFVLPLVKNISSIKNIFHEMPFDKKYSIIIELRGNWQTLFYAFKNRPLIRLDRGTVRISNKLKGLKKHEIYTNFDIIKPLLPNDEPLIFPQITIDEKSVYETDGFISKNNLKKFAILHCGARRILRQWPTKNFALIAKLLSTKYNLKIVFAGIEEDEKIIDEIIYFSNVDSIKCIKNFSLLNFAYLVKKAELYIGNESGPLHIAAVMNTPLIGIYGPGIKDIFYPIGNKSKVVHHILDCNPCDQIHCVRPDNPCINLVTVDEVISEIENLIGKSN
ncbi:MAG: glycosyltransferase family 9 protein [Bacteroidetes bacterium]|nr:glycosyltransferase family 9 protein [Bacteroidota bacterium]